MACCMACFLTVRRPGRPGGRGGWSGWPPSAPTMSRARETSCWRRKAAALRSARAPRASCALCFREVRTRFPSQLVDVSCPCPACGCLLYIAFVTSPQPQRVLAPSVRAQVLRHVFYRHTGHTFYTSTSCEAPMVWSRRRTSPGQSRGSPIRPRGGPRARAARTYVTVRPRVIEYGI